MGIKIELNLHDIWVGIYWKVGFVGRTTWIGWDIYICIIPCLPIHIWNKAY